MNPIIPSDPIPHKDHTRFVEKRSWHQSEQQWHRIAGKDPDRSFWTVWLFTKVLKVASKWHHASTMSKYKSLLHTCSTKRLKVCLCAHGNIATNTLQRQIKYFAVEMVRNHFSPKARQVIWWHHTESWCAQDYCLWYMCNLQKAWHNGTITCIRPPIHMDLKRCV